MLAPIIVLGYKRPDHLKRALDSLSANFEAMHSKVYIFIDGPKNSSEIAEVEAARNVAKLDYGFGDTELIFSDTNKGLADSVIAAVTQVISVHGQVIVIEDDLIVSKTFLKFMNQGLNLYRGNSLVASIQGYQYPIKLAENVCLFLRGADCWGWATWSERWLEFNKSSSQLLENIKRRNLDRKFNLFGALRNTGLLASQDSGEIDSWAIRWHASMFLRGKYSLYPPISLVNNTGTDGTGTHEGFTTMFGTKISNNEIWTYPSEIKESIVLRNKLIMFFYSHKRIPELLRRLVAS